MERCALVGVEVKLKGVVEGNRINVDLEDSLDVFGSLLALHYKNYYLNVKQHKLYVRKTHHINFNRLFNLSPSRFQIDS